jgi:hypothetical protein
MNVPAEHVLHLPGVAPVSWIAILEPEDMRREIGGNVLAVRHARHLAVLVSEDFDGIVAVSDGALVERTLDAHVDLSLPGLLQSVGYARSDEIHMTPEAPAPSTSGKKQNASTGANFATV